MTKPEELKAAVEGLIDHATEEDCGICAVYVGRIREALATPASSGAAPALLTDAQINETRQRHGVTSNGRGIKEFAQVADFAREIAALASREASPTASRAATDPAFEEASSLAKWLFKTHYAQDPDYASGKVTWALCDSTAGIISQIDNMVSGLVRPAAQPASPAPLTDERAAFEAWMLTGALDHLPELDRDADGNYEDFDVQRAWRGWEARADALASPQVAPYGHLITPVDDRYGPERFCRGPLREPHGSAVKARGGSVVPLYAAPVQVAPAGFKLVPVKPTPEMADAAVQAICYGPEGGFTRIAGPSRCWSAMLAAAPATPMQAPAVADDARDAALWREHAAKLDALVAYCPTCCQGSCASKDMTRDEIIFECGKTVGRSTPAAKPAEEQGS